MPSSWEECCLELWGNTINEEGLALFSLILSHNFLSSNKISNFSKIVYPQSVIEILYFPTISTIDRDKFLPSVPSHYEYLL